MSELREALGAALDAEQSVPESAPAVELTSAPESTPSLEPEPVPVTSGTVRDSLGRFVKAAEKVTGEPAPEPAPEPAALAEPVAAAPAEPVVAPEVKPPQSWTPAAREVWANVPPAAQQEILRREGEIQRGLQEASSARNIANQLSELVTPYLPRMRMQGATPMAALSNLLQTETILGTGTQQQRAETVAKLVKAYDIDIAALDAALAGAPAPEHTRTQSEVQQLIQQELSPVRDFMRTVMEAQNSRAQAHQQSAASELEKFAADPEHPFFEQVREDMADLIEVALRRGQELSLAQAYHAAVMANPQTREQAEAAFRARQAASLSAAATRAKAAAVSLPGTSVTEMPGATQEPADLRGTIAASIASLSRT